MIHHATNEEKHYSNILRSTNFTFYYTEQKVLGKTYCIEQTVRMSDLQLYVDLNVFRVSYVNTII